MIRKREFGPQRERWEQLDLLLKAALRLPAEQRDAYLTEKCAGDDALLREAQSLLLFDDEREDSTPGMGLRASWHLDQAPPDEFAGYRIIEKIGRGGMGVVYLAEQQQPKRSVALKLIRPGGVSEDFRSRFALEAEALGKLKHPAIAQIYEAGSLDSRGLNQPFIAMEYVEGVDLATYLEEHELDLDARCTLLRKICEGVQHAHLSGVIHRDLSPRNILIDERGDPKIIDFGVARMIDTEHTSMTMTGQFVGTMSSMSPEQCQGRSEEIDSRTDVYSLGVLGYRILSGQEPYELQSTPVLEALRVICEEVPPPIGRIRSGLRGDLEKVIGKALEKDPARRYSTAAEFAADLGRFQRREPVSARPATVFYQLRRLASRHRAGVVALLAIIIGGLLLTAQAFTSQRAFLVHRQDSFLAAMAVFSMQKSLTPEQRADLAGAAERIESQFAGDPAMQADLHDYFSSMFGKLGFDRESDEHAAQAFQLHRQVSGPTHPKTLRIAKIYADSRANQNDLTTAAEICREFARICQETNGPEHETTLRMRMTLADISALRGEWKAAEEQYQKIHGVQVRRDREGHPDRLEVETSLARALIELGRLDEGERLAAATAAAQKREQGPENNGTLRARIIWADALLRKGRLDEAEAQLAEVFRVIDRFGEQHIYANSGKTVRARWLAASGRDAEARAEIEAVVDRVRQKHPDDHWRVRRVRTAQEEILARLEGSPGRSPKN